MVLYNNNQGVGIIGGLEMVLYNNNQGVGIIGGGGVGNGSI